MVPTKALNDAMIAVHNRYRGEGGKALYFYVTRELPERPVELALVVRSGRREFCDAIASDFKRNPGRTF